MPSATQTDRATWRRLATPLVLAAIVTVANAAKPVLVDDTAYLAFARHVAAHPLDPYGFEIFWYTAPEPAMEVLCPPVLPYWLAAGYRIFGDNPVLLKLWLFPFAWLLAASLRELLRRFARGVETVALPLIVLSPAVLPMVNVMLDIPAAALGLAAVVAFIRAAESNRARTAILAGLLAALAMQTKYTALLVPPVFLWHGYTHRRLRLAVVAGLVAAMAFAAWEAFLGVKYGRSHFLFHAGAQSGGGDVIRDKLALVPALVGHLGCLSVGIGFYAARAVRIPRRFLVLAALLWVLGVALITVLPYQSTVLVHGKQPGHDKLTLPATLWRTSGTGVLLVAAASAVMLLIRGGGRGLATGRRADTLFVVGWVLLELAGYFALTPFPAARRLVGLTLALGLLAARTVSRVSRARPDRRPPRWSVPLGIAAGVLVMAVDTFDAMPEEAAAVQAAEVVAAERPTGTTWYVGHWGFQYYCERAGMRPVVAGRTRLEAGDFLVLPLFPDEKGFWRPFPGWIRIHPPADAVELLAEMTWNDRLSAQTIPNFYGGVDPLVGRDHPRLRVAVYRVLRAFEG